MRALVVCMLCAAAAATAGRSRCPSTFLRLADVLMHAHSYTRLAGYACVLAAQNTWEQLTSK